MNREDNLCWFHGKVSRDKAEQILREGTYIPIINFTMRLHIFTFCLI